MARRRNPSANLLILGGITILAIGAIVVVTQLRSPSVSVADPTTTSSSTTTQSIPTTTTIPPTTTTTPFVFSGETGEPFEWLGNQEFPDQTPISLVEHDGEFFLFTGGQETETPAVVPTGFRTWYSRDGLDWSLLSEVDGVAAESVTSTRFGLIAVGSDPATGEGLIMRSTDGFEWDRTAIPTSLPVGLLRTFENVVATDDLVYIPFQLSQDFALRDSLVTRAIEDHFGDSIADWSLSVVEGGEWSVALFGPLGVPIGIATLDEIGLTQADLEHTYEDLHSFAWISTDGVTWHEQHLPRTSSSAFVGPDGRVWARQQPLQAPGAQFTQDATWVLNPADLTWESTGPAFTGYPFHQWPGGLVGRGPAGQAAYSPDGTFWRNIELGSHLNNEVTWDFWPMGGGEAGIVFIGWIMGFEFTEPDPVEWTQDDHTIHADRNDIEIRRDGLVVLRISRRSTGVSDTPWPVWDQEAETLTFLDRFGEAVIALDLTLVPDNLEVDTALFPDYDPYRPMGHALLFSDARTWQTPGVLQTEYGPPMSTIQDLSPITGNTVRHVLLSADRVILVSEGPGATEVFVGLVPEAP